MSTAMQSKFVNAVVLTATFALTACGGHKTRDDGPGSGRIPNLPGDAVPRKEPRSKHGNGRDMGNGPQYEVLNKTYTVLQSSAGFRERGVASWYGKKFHGNLTSNREVYDMYKMTAAHKTLPLPTYVQVRNLRNNKTVVVRVNDRGPFVDNRIIDLSYAAALKLDLIRDGTGLVEITAYNFDGPTKDRPRGTAPRKPPLVSTPAIRDDSDRSISDSPRIFVQVGAFGDRKNAERRLAVLSRSGINPAFIYEDDSSGQILYRVRIGPVAGVPQYDSLVEKLHSISITDPYLITE
jgi:peptidoglycan lytic transglycosylase